MNEGEGCSACGRAWNVGDDKEPYSTKFDLSMLWALRLYAKHGGAATRRELEDMGLPGPSYSKLAKMDWWELTEAIGRRRKITEFGLAFLRGAVSIREYVIRQNKRVIGYEGKVIYITDVAPYEESA